MKLEFININSQELLNYVKMKAESGLVPVFNFYSVIQIGEWARALEPLPNVFERLSFAFTFDDDQYTLDFDRQYAFQLLSNQNSFIMLMKIMMLVETMDEVIVITNHSNPYVEVVVDSLIKFIQQRYSIQSYIINDIGDIDSFATSNFKTEEGFNNYMMDVNKIKRFIDPSKLLHNYQQEKELRQLELKGEL